MREVLCCSGCGKPYSEFPLDVHLPDDQWLLVNGREGGVLCAQCIVERASGIPIVTVLNASLDISDARTFEQLQRDLSQARETIRKIVDVLNAEPAKERT